jgi:Uma2 family endonuclease
MNGIITAPLPGTTEDPRYPDFSRRFIGDTDFHNISTIQIREGVEDHNPEIYVASNLVFYYKKGDARCRRDPDVLAAKGVGKHHRRSYRLWEEKILPCTLFEIASRRTWRIDIDDKRWLFARLRIPEYFLFDPEERYLDSTLLGFRSVKGRSVPIKANADGSLTSRELGLRLKAEGILLRMFDLRTGEMVRTRSERANREADRARQERDRADRLAAEVERLRAQLGRHGTK